MSSTLPLGSGNNGLTRKRNRLSLSSVSLSSVSTTHGEIHLVLAQDCLRETAQSWAERDSLLPGLKFLWELKECLGILSRLHFNLCLADVFPPHGKQFDFVGPFRHQDF